MLSLFFMVNSEMSVMIDAADETSVRRVDVTNVTPSASHCDSAQAKSTQRDFHQRRSLLGVKRTWLVATHMSASDPKRTLALGLMPFLCVARYDAVS
jgi:hypothetical protein